MLFLEKMEVKNRLISLIRGDIKSPFYLHSEDRSQDRSRARSESESESDYPVSLSFYWSSSSYSISTLSPLYLTFSVGSYPVRVII
jgi:hypothetical protein